MEKTILLGIFVLIVLVGCLEGSKTCSDGSFVVGIRDCPSGITFQVNVQSSELTKLEVFEGRIEATLSLEYTSSKDYDALWVYPVGYEEDREFLHCTSGQCQETVEWNYFKLTQNNQETGYYEAVVRFCGEEETPDMGDFGICRDLTLTGYLN